VNNKTVKQSSGTTGNRHPEMMDCKEAGGGDFFEGKRGGAEGALALSQMRYGGKVNKFKNWLSSFCA
jgi:hypothetical protein